MELKSGSNRQLKGGPSPPDAARNVEYAALRVAAGKGELVVTTIAVLILRLKGLVSDTPDGICDFDTDGKRADRASSTGSCAVRESRLSPVGRPVAVQVFVPDPPEAVNV